MFEKPRRGGQARNLTKHVPKILDLKSSSEQVFSKNWRWVSLESQLYSVLFRQAVPSMHYPESHLAILNSSIFFYLFIFYYYYFFMNGIDYSSSVI